MRRGRERRSWTDRGLGAPRGACGFGASVLERRDEVHAPPLHRPSSDVSRPSRRPVLRELAEAPEDPLRLHAVQAHHGLPARLFRRRQRYRLGVANFLAVDLSPYSIAYETISPNERINWVMNHELVHIATVGPSREARAAVTDILRRQGASERGRPRVDSLLLPHHPARRRATMASRRDRRVRRDVGRRRPGTRPGRVRRDGVPIEGPGSDPVLRSPVGHG